MIDLACRGPREQAAQASIMRTSDHERAKFALLLRQLGTITKPKTQFKSATIRGVSPHSCRVCTSVDCLGSSLFLQLVRIHKQDAALSLSTRIRWRSRERISTRVGGMSSSMSGKLLIGAVTGLSDSHGTNSCTDTRLSTSERRQGEKNKSEFDSRANDKPPHYQDKWGHGQTGNSSHGLLRRKLRSDLVVEARG